MADSVLFEVDAAKILAKLHLAGRQATGGNGFIVNTGILDDDDKAKPDNPGNVAFDLKNKTGDYQVGYVIDIRYTKTYGLDSTLSQLSELVAKKANAKVDAKVDDKDEKLEVELKDKVKAAFASTKEKLDEKLLDSVDGLKEVKELANKVLKNESEDYKKAIDAVKAEAIKNLKAYLNVFAGADNVNAFSDANMITVSSKVKGPNDKSLVSDYEIQPIAEAEKAKLVAASTAKSGQNDNCAEKVCFRVQYHLDIDK